MCLKCVASINKKFHIAFRACSTPFEECRVNTMKKYRVSEFHPIPVSSFPLEMSTPQILVYT